MPAGDDPSDKSPDKTGLPVPSNGDFRVKLDRKQQQALNNLAEADPDAVLRVMRQWMQQSNDT